MSKKEIIKYVIKNQEQLVTRICAIGQARGHGSGNSKFTPDGNGWRWKEAGGDNSVYIEHIIGDFYYYLEEY